MRGRSKIPHTSVRMGEELHAKARDLATVLGMSLNSYIVTSVEKMNERVLAQDMTRERYEKLQAQEATPPDEPF